MRDVVCCEEGGDQVGDGSGLPAVGAELECVQSSLSVRGRKETACVASGDTRQQQKTGSSGFGRWRDSLAKVVEHHDVGVHVEEVVGVGGVVLRRPHLRLRAAVREHVVAVLGLVVHAVEAGHLVDKHLVSGWTLMFAGWRTWRLPSLVWAQTTRTTYVFEEDVCGFVLLRTDGGLKQRQEDVLQHPGVVRYQLLGPEDVTEGKRADGDLSSWSPAGLCQGVHRVGRTVFSGVGQNSLDPGNLDHPPHVGGVHFVLNEPAGQVVPLAGRASVNGQARLGVLVLALLQVLGNFLETTPDRRK